MMWSRLRLVHRLGFRNCAEVVLHRLGLRSGWYELRAPIGHAYSAGAAFGSVANPRPAPAGVARAEIIERADALQEGIFCYFDKHVVRAGSPPDWFANPWDSRSREQPVHWSRCDEFRHGDIKVVWEPSRFHWAVTFAQAFRLTGDERYVRTLAAWLDDWVRTNPCNLGPNWRCAQETSIRLINLLTAAWICGIGNEAQPELVRFVREHLQRISLTLNYGRAQDNNHGTTEAAALLIGGEWLAAGRDAGSRSCGQRMARRGRRYLEERVHRLVLRDGSFSQYSTNYHRLFLDTVSLAEWWCRQLGVPGIKRSCGDRVRRAIDWLLTMVDESSGDAPNLGGNDGARLLALAPVGYRDNRPTLQLASILFSRARLWEQGPWDDACRWLGVRPDSVPLTAPTRRSRQFTEGGFVVLSGRDGSTWGILRVPTFRFRPSQADAFHLDIWTAGVNLTRDAGTYSYNCEEPWAQYFPGTRAHCTCEFDGRDQMPRLGRFLFGDWLQCEECGPLAEGEQAVSWSGSYRDRWGALHRRTVCLQARTWKVRDELMNYREKAVIRWRLAPEDWRLSESSLTSRLASIRVTCSCQPRRIELCEGWESRFYLERSPLPVLEIELPPGAAVVDTVIELNPDR